VIEFIYSESNEFERREMIFAFYGNYFYLLKEVEDKQKGVNNQLTLKQFLEKKP